MPDKEKKQMTKFPFSNISQVRYLYRLPHRRDGYTTGSYFEIFIFLLLFLRSHPKRFAQVDFAWEQRVERGD